VTHVANVARKDLPNLDMLPKLRDKVLVTKELAPIFRGRKEELEDNFSTLITVLDGKGFTSNSGTQGERGYKDDIVFNWIGATTPIGRQTYQLMSQLGTRMLFYWVSVPSPNEDQLLEYAEKEDAGIAEKECQKAVNAFLIEFFNHCPVSSVAPEAVSISRERLLQIVRWSRLLAICRAGVKYEKDESTKVWVPIAASSPEGPHKIVNSFKLLARGHALIHGRTEVDDSDLALIEHVAQSSMPEHLRCVVYELRAKGRVDAAECEYLSQVSRPTARKYLRELTLMGVTFTSDGGAESNEPEAITLRPEFEWLRLPPKQGQPTTQESSRGQRAKRTRSPKKAKKNLEN
jgi:hypothetical protein